MTANSHLVIPKKIAMISLFFFLVIYFLPLIDNLTGALFKLKIMPEGFIGSPSQIARFSLFIFVIWLVNHTKQEKPLRMILITSCYLLLVEATIACFHLNLKAFLSGVVFSTKILFALSCYYYTAHWLNSDKEKTVYVIKQIINYGTFVAILVLIAYLSGFHIANYKVGFATRGLFISGNGLGIVLGISTIFLVHFSKKITLITLAHILLLLLTTALLGTKASIIFLFTALILLLIKFFKRAPISTLVLITVISLYLLIPLIEVLGALFENIIYKFNNIDDKLTLFASSRDLFIKNAFAQIKLDDFNALRILFGGGAYYAYSDYNSGITFLRKSLENDLFELFFSYGIVMVIAYIASYIYALKTLIKKADFIIVLALSLIFIHSITMGHVLFNGTSAITYALCLAIAIKGVKVSSNDF